MGPDPVRGQTPDTAGIKFGPYWLTPGIRPLNACTFFYSSFMFVTLVTFLNFVQPYLLEEVLKVPAERQGAVTGGLNFIHESVALLVMGYTGAISDRYTRRSVLMIGLAIWFLGLLLFPMAGSLPELYVYRVVVAVGVAVTSVIVIATMQDYPQDISRGKWGGTNSFITSFAILTVSLVLVRLPHWYTDAGFDAIQAGRFSFWTAAAIMLISAIAIRFGYYGGHIAGQDSSRSMFAGLTDGLRALRGRPRLALAYGTAFAARGDMVVVGAFYTLWFVRAGADQGIGSEEALARAGISMAALLLATWIWAPTWGFILDRINHIQGLAIAMTLAAIGYFTIGQVDDPYNMPVMMAATFILGIGEISAIISGNAMLGYEAPPAIRGSVAGVFSVAGTFGILSATWFGGQVFDAIGYSAPFLMMAAVNTVIVIWAVGLILTRRHVRGIQSSSV